MNNFSDFFSTMMAVSSICMGIAGMALLFLTYASKNKLTKLRQTVSEQGVTLIFMVSFLAVFGSLMYSVVLGLEPCNLCWYQRIIIYPIPILLIIGKIRKEANLLLPYINVMVWAGLILSIYQFLSQKFPAFAHFTKVAESCGVSGPSCTDVQVSVFGFITIPAMSMFTFFFLVALIKLLRTNQPRHQ